MLQLVALFTPEDKLSSTIKLITSSYSVINNKIFVLSTINDLICSFNIDKQIQQNVLPGALLVHRKKETNTLYTINSLNEIIRKHNNGILDNMYHVNWNDYKNSIILVSDGKLKILETKIFKIIPTQNEKI